MANSCGREIAAAHVVDLYGIGDLGVELQAHVARCISRVGGRQHRIAIDVECNILPNHLAVTDISG